MKNYYVIKLAGGVIKQVRFDTIYTFISFHWLILQITNCDCTSSANTILNHLDNVLKNTVIMYTFHIVLSTFKSPYPFFLVSDQKRN